MNITIRRTSLIMFVSALVTTVAFGACLRTTVANATTASSDIDPTHNVRGVQIDYSGR